MGRIVRLDDRLSNKIAAGEVVERPASVVKELAENAVDAGSTTVEIEVEDGGLGKIKIVDNGSGIEPEDVELAFDRHATSKIKDEKDLFHIETLGFRGEALPSIASVARVEMKTGTGEHAGTHVVIEGGKMVEQRPASGRKGTEITVTRLFYNTPARLKHLKTVHTELGNITDVVYRLALGYPQVVFRLSHNGKRSFQTNGNGDVRQVLAAIYGLNTARKTVPVAAKSIDFDVTGYIAKPEVTRASRQHMQLFMNRRYIRNYAVTKAVLEAFHTLLPIRRYPIAVIHIEMDPTLIDVNVHPSKLEARLSKERELCRLVEQAVGDALKRLQLIPQAPAPKQHREQSDQQQFLFHPRQDKEIPKDASSGTARSLPKQENGTAVRESKDGYESKFGEDVSSVPSESEETAVDTERRTERIPYLSPIGQLHGTYILAQNENGLFIIDQHAAQERVKYEFYREKVRRTNGQVQELLLPMTFEFTASEASVVEQHLADLRHVGVFLEPFGPSSFIVRSHPDWFPEGFEKETIEDLVHQVTENSMIDIGRLREEAAILMSCKRSIKANHHLREDEMIALLESLRTCEDPFTCPHGRPVIVRFSGYDLEKMFKRVM
ncbi:MAG TPA: DNA mismatch repair endonuclease MutL [Bacillales bacterium]|nr:DNA mismatch repair endonuclease MutL [Bacillales bacterium]